MVIYGPNCTCFNVQNKYFGKMEYSPLYTHNFLTISRKQLRPRGQRIVNENKKG